MQAKKKANKKGLIPFMFPFAKTKQTKNKKEKQTKQNKTKNQIRS